MDFIAEMQSYFRGDKIEALIFIIPAGIGLVIDGVAERRAHPYIAALVQIAADET